MSNPTPSRYRWTFKGVSFDFYRLCEILGVKSHAQAHALKKIIRAGQSIKPLTQDIDEAIDALRRFREMVVEDEGLEGQTELPLTEAENPDPWSSPTKGTLRDAILHAYQRVALREVAGPSTDSTTEVEDLASLLAYEKKLKNKIAGLALPSLEVPEEPQPLQGENEQNQKEEDAHDVLGLRGQGEHSHDHPEQGEDHQGDHDGNESGKHVEE